jgi:hypothetical protein
MRPLRTRGISLSGSSAVRGHSQPTSYRPILFLLIVHRPWSIQPPTAAHLATMSEGLTRRRGAGGTSPNPSQNAFDTPPVSAARLPTGNASSGSRPSSSLARPAMGAGGATTTTSTAAAAGGSGGTGAVEGRAKIAFDPRDYENGSMGSEYERMPRLTIMEEVLLLGLKDKQVGGQQRHPWTELMPRRATSLSGTTTSRTRSAGASSSNSRSDVE